MSNDALTFEVQQPLKVSVGMEPTEPLWKRVPTTDKDGKPLSDFMMLIPGLRKKSGVYQKQTVSRLAEVLSHYQETVVFADLNFKLSVLWVSIHAVPGMCLEIPAAIKVAVPEAMLIASKYQE